MTTVNSKEQEFGCEKTFLPTLLKHTVDVGRTKLFGRRVGHNHQPDTVLVLAGSERLHQFFYMSLGNSMEQTFDVVDLEDGERYFPACVALRAEVANEYRLPRRTVVDKDLEDVFGNDLSRSHLRTVGARIRCQMKAAQEAYSEGYARSSFVDKAGKQVACTF